MAKIRQKNLTDSNHEFGLEIISKSISNGAQYVMLHSKIG
jgi:hypothetical protein